MVLIAPTFLQELKGRQIYNRSFPKVERRPWRILKKSVRAHTSDFLVVVEEKKVVGIVVLLKSGSLVLLDYFAFDPKKRGKGYGTKALSLLKNKYEKDCLFIEIEDSTYSAYDKACCIRRKKFYEKNGFYTIGMHVMCFSNHFQIMCATDAITFDDYKKIYRDCLGPRYDTKLQLLSNI